MRRNPRPSAPSEADSVLGSGPRGGAFLSVFSVSQWFNSFGPDPRPSVSSEADSVSGLRARGGSGVQPLPCGAYSAMNHKPAWIHAGMVNIASVVVMSTICTAVSGWPP